MNLFVTQNIRLVLFFFVIIIIATSPIWGVEYFINQDGSPHLYNAHIMGELLNGNPHFLKYYAFNSISVPNSTGHWLLVLLLEIFPPFLATKVIMIFTFAAFVASIGWLRFVSAGRDCLKTSLLIGAALGLNALWFLGSYNFSIGMVMFLVSVATFYSWRERMSVAKTFGLSLLLLIAYLSHLVPFGVLTGSVMLIAMFSGRKYRMRNILMTALALIPIIPMLIGFKMLSTSGDGFFPAWRAIGDNWSFLGILNQFRSCDPLIFITRKSFPFSDANSSIFAIFSPIIWVFASYIFLSFATIRVVKRDLLYRKELFPFMVLFVALIAAAVLGPDDFGLSNGSMLRERLLLCGLCFFVPLFRINKQKRTKLAVQFCLGFILIFQTAALWDYSLRSDAKAKELLSARSEIADGDSIASVIIFDDGARFHSLPELNINTLNGLDRNILVWDNYELAYYLFPIIAKNEKDKKFILDLSESHAYVIGDTHENLEEKLSRFDRCLQENHGKINTMLMWGRNERYEHILQKWFEPEPYFTNGKVRLFHHKSS